ncbi:MAG: hypothetical protein KDB79_16895, partial [Acidobacteria bacterium]|nr:hypothetical protein [Acidobacteriota bacterium]
RKMIFNDSKDGCCFHQREGYKVVNNALVKVYEHTEEASTANSGGIPEVTTKQLVNGKWKTWDQKSATRVSFDRGSTSKTISLKLNANEPIKWLSIGAAAGQILKVTASDPAADLSLVDFKGDIGMYESYISLPESKDLIAKLKGNGDYFLEVSSDADVSITISIVKDKGEYDFSDVETDN